MTAALTLQRHFVSPSRVPKTLQTLETVIGCFVCVSKLLKKKQLLFYIIYFDATCVETNSTILNDDDNYEENVNERKTLTTVILFE